MQFYIGGEKLILGPNSISYLTTKHAWKEFIMELFEENTIMEDLASLLEAGLIEAYGIKNSKLDSVKKAAFLRMCCQENLETIQFIKEGCDI